METTLPAGAEPRASAAQAGTLEARMVLGELREQMFGRRDPTKVGRFTLLRLLGRGSYGAVYLADDTELRRRVAVKLLAASGGESTARARLVREAQALARLNHPNVLTIHDVGVEDDRVFIAMEYVEATLRDWFGEHPPGTLARFAAVLDLALGVARGLAVAHEAGIVHRDIKPANILVGADGRPRLADFGLAREVLGDASADVERPTATVADEQTLTRTGDILGTPAYMAPEQFRGRGDAASDQFSWCATFWEATYGSRPFEADEGWPPRPPSERAEVPRWWRELLARGLQREPSERWPSVAELLGELERRKSGTTRAAIRRTAIALAAIGVVATAVVGVREAERRGALAECDRLAQEVEATWPGRMEPVRAGLLATGLPFAETTADKLAPWLDGWASSWQDARRDVCVRATVDRTLAPEVENDARACLELQRATVDGLIAPLELSDPRRVVRAVERTAGLDSAATCLDPDRLARTAWPDDARRDAVLDLRRRAREVADADEAGDPSAVATARALLREAEALGFEPVAGEVRFTLGDALLDESLRESEDLLRQAYFDAIRLDLPALAVDAALRLEYWTASVAVRPSEALEWSRHAEMWIDRMGEREGLLGAELASVRGVAHRARGEHREAIRVQMRALAMRETILGPEHPEVAITLLNLGILRVLNGDPRLGMAHFERALAIRTAVFGGEHPATWAIRGSMANAHRATGDFQEAARIHERHLAFLEATYGPDHPEIAITLNNLANVDSALGKFDEAIALHERCVRIRRAAYGPDHDRVGEALMNLGVTISDAGRHEEALPVLEDALAIRAAALGPDHVDVAYVLQNQASVLVELGRLADAEPLFLRVIAMREAAYGPDDPRVADTLFPLSTVYHRSGRLDDADRVLRRVLAMRRAQEGEDGRWVGRTYEALGEIAQQRGHLDESIDFRERALGIMLARRESGSRISRTEFALAEGLARAGRDHERAIMLALAARNAVGDVARVAQIDAWLQTQRRSR